MALTGAASGSAYGQIIQATQVPHTIPYVRPTFLYHLGSTTFTTPPSICISDYLYQGGHSSHKNSYQGLKIRAEQKNIRGGRFRQFSENSVKFAKIQLKCI
jgi:hypothetical protein